MAFDAHKDEKVLPRFVGRMDKVLDGSKWSGTDVMGPGWIVTRRFVEFLQRVHAFPFQAEPIKTYVGSSNDHQMELLQSARKLKD